MSNKGTAGYKGISGYRDDGVYTLQEVYEKSLKDEWTQLLVDYLVIAGGGGGNGGTVGAGGGAGGYRTSYGTSGGQFSAEIITSLGQSNYYAVTVGGGGAVSTSGSPSTFATITSIGGGFGGGRSGAGGSGGSGGGSGGSTSTPGILRQGTAGGTGQSDNASGGGGGAGTKGGNFSGGNTGGPGGAGLASVITGSSVVRAGGGGGAGIPSGGAGGAGGDFKLVPSTVQLANGQNAIGIAISKVGNKDVKSFDVSIVQNEYKKDGKTVKTDEKGNPIRKPTTVSLIPSGIAYNKKDNEWYMQGYTTKTVFNPKTDKTEVIRGDYQEIKMSKNSGLMNDFKARYEVKGDMLDYYNKLNSGEGNSNTTNSNTTASAEELIKKYSKQ